MTGYIDHLTLIAPPKNVIYDIGRYKRAAARLIGDYPGMNSPAHISINHQHRCKPFTARHSIAQMGEKLGLVPPFELKISNFKYFTHGHTGMTIYACVVMDQFSERWFKGLQSSIRVIQKNIVPHITVVKNIPPDKFQKLWPKFESCKFNTSFMADKLTVLERETYVETSRWRIYKEFRLGDRLMEY